MLPPGFPSVPVHLRWLPWGVVFALVKHQVVRMTVRTDNRTWRLVVTTRHRKRLVASFFKKHATHVIVPAAQQVSSTSFRAPVQLRIFAVRQCVMFVLFSGSLHRQFFLTDS